MAHLLVDEFFLLLDDPVVALPEFVEFVEHFAFPDLPQGRQVFIVLDLVELFPQIFIAHRLADTLRDQVEALAVAGKLLEDLLVAFAEALHAFTLVFRVDRQEVGQLQPYPIGIPEFLIPKLPVMNGQAVHTYRNS